MESNCVLFFDTDKNAADIGKVISRKEDLLQVELVAAAGVVKTVNEHYVISRPTLNTFETSDTVTEALDIINSISVMIANDIVRKQYNKPTGSQLEAPDKEKALQLVFQVLCVQEKMWTRACETRTALGVTALLDSRQAWLYHNEEYFPSYRGHFEFKPKGFGSHARVMSLEPLVSYHALRASANERTRSDILKFYNATLLAPDSITRHEILPKLANLVAMNFNYPAQRFIILVERLKEDHSHDIACTPCGNFYIAGYVAVGFPTALLKAARREVKTECVMWISEGFRKQSAEERNNGQNSIAEYVYIALTRLLLHRGGENFPLACTTLVNNMQTIRFLWKLPFLMVGLTLDGQRCIFEMQEQDAAAWDDSTSHNLSVKSQKERQRIKQTGIIPFGALLVRLCCSQEEERLTCDALKTLSLRDGGELLTVHVNERCISVSMKASQTVIMNPYEWSDVKNITPAEVDLSMQNIINAVFKRFEKLSTPSPLHGALKSLGKYRDSYFRQLEHHAKEHPRSESYLPILCLSFVALPAELLRTTAREEEGLGKWHQLPSSYIQDFVEPRVVNAVCRYMGITLTHVGLCGRGKALWVCVSAKNEGSLRVPIITCGVLDFSEHMLVALQPCETSDLRFEEVWRFM